MRIYRGFLLPVLGVLILVACSQPVEPPLDREVTLQVKARTMGDVAGQMTAQAGVPFVLGDEFVPDAVLRDEFMVFFPRASLGSHIQDLKDGCVIEIIWEKDHFVLHDLPLAKCQ